MFTPVFHRRSHILPLLRTYGLEVCGESDLYMHCNVDEDKGEDCEFQSRNEDALGHWI